MDRITTTSNNEKATRLDWETDLAELLLELSSVQQELLDVLTRMRDRMVAGDTEGMTRLKAQEEKLAGRLEACQQRRRELLERANREGLPVDSIRQLATVLPGPKRDKLGNQVKEATGRMRLLRHQSLANWVLAQRTLLHLSQMLEIIATGGRLQPTYGKGAPAGSSGSLVDGAA